jgi:hypothetical protein
MISTTDEDIEALLGKRKLTPPNFTCNGGNRVGRFCTNETCQNNALCCNDEDCRSC